MGDMNMTRKNLGPTIYRHRSGELNADSGVPDGLIRPAGDLCTTYDYSRWGTAQ
jgi:hypothetical protein